MSTPQRIGREKRAPSAIVGDCVLHDGTCFRHERDRPLTKPRKQSLRDRDPVIAAELDEGASGFAADEASCGASTVLAVWTCGQGHTYCATPNSRTNVRGGTGCGICASKRPTLEHNLAAVAPVISLKSGMCCGTEGFHPIRSCLKVTRGSGGHARWLTIMFGKHRPTTGTAA